MIPLWIIEAYYLSLPMANRIELLVAYLDSNPKNIRASNKQTKLYEYIRDNIPDITSDNTVLDLMTKSGLSL